MKVKIKKLNTKAIIPTYGSQEAAGADLYACMEGDTLIKSGETVMIKTGISMEIPKGYVGLVYARSGIAFKNGIAPSNKVGVIDSDYRGEIIIATYITADFEEVEDLNDSERGHGGFGSTGTK